jgi:hypothetical protein
MAENGVKCYKVAYYFKKIIKLTYLPAFSAFVSNFLALSDIFSSCLSAFSAFVSNFYHFQPFSAVSAIFSFRLIIGKRVIASRSTLMTKKLNYW